MSIEDALKVEVKMNKKLSIGFVGIIFSVIGICVAFYYGTKSDMRDLYSKHQEHEREMSTIREELKEKASVESIQSIEYNVREIRMDNRKIMEILLEKGK